MENQGLTQYYRGYKIEREQNSTTYSVNGVKTIFMTIADVKAYIDNKEKRK